VDYGPIVTYGFRPRRSDDTRRHGLIAVQEGAFCGFMFTREIHFGARLLHGGGTDGGGLQLRVGADVSYRLGSHDVLTLSPGLALADGAFMRSTYGVTARQAQRDDLPAYNARAGLRHVGLDIDWGSELSTKFMLDTGLSWTRLAGGAAHSPLIARRDETTFYTALSYHF